MNYQNWVNNSSDIADIEFVWGGVGAGVVYKVIFVSKVILGWVLVELWLSLGFDNNVDNSRQLFTILIRTLDSINFLEALRERSQEVSSQFVLNFSQYCSFPQPDLLIKRRQNEISLQYILPNLINYSSPYTIMLFSEGYRRYLTLCLTLSVSQSVS